MLQKQTRVLAIDDEIDSAEWMQLYLTQRGYDVRTAQDGRSSELLCQVWKPDVVLLDLVLPDIDGIDLLRRLKAITPTVPVVIVSGRATVPSAVQALKHGAYSLLEKPVQPDHLLEMVEQARLARPDAAAVQESTDGIERLGGMLSRCDSMKRLFELIRMTAPTLANVLILGENGTGKELVATAVHDLSTRREQPFIKINCAAIPSELLESELFGHRRGSFTGAMADKKGLLEVAQRGSLLLDEIGEMPPQLQIKLLRVLQEREFRPVGGTQDVKADFRLIAATNIDPIAAVRRGQLREDLYFRMNTITLNLPPLRERTGDISLLADTFLRQYAERHRRPVDGIHEATMLVLERHHWPGNVRELEAAIERAVIVAKGRNVTVHDLPESVRQGKVGPVTSLPTGCTLEEIERLAILQTLEFTNWNKRAAAGILGIHRPTLYSKLRKYRLWPRQQREEQGPLQ